MRKAPKKIPKETGKGTEHSTRSHCFVPFSTGIVGSGNNSPHIMAAAMKILGKAEENNKDRTVSVEDAVRQTLSSTRSKTKTCVNTSLLTVLPLMLERACTRVIDSMGPDGVHSGYVNESAQAHDRGHVDSKEKKNGQQENKRPTRPEDMNLFYQNTILNNMAVCEDYASDALHPFVGDTLSEIWDMGHSRAAGAEDDVTFPDVFGRGTTELDFMDEVGVATIVGAINIVRIARDPLHTKKTPTVEGITRRIRVAFAEDMYGTNQKATNHKALTAAKLTFYTMFWHLLYDFATQDGRPGAHLFSKDWSQLDEKNSIMGVMPYIIDGLIADDEDESEQGDGKDDDGDGKGSDDDNNNDGDNDGDDDKDNDGDNDGDDNGLKDDVDNRGVPATDGSSSVDDGGKTVGNADEGNGGLASLKACGEGASIPGMGSAGPVSTAGKVTRAAD